MSLLAISLTLNFILSVERLYHLWQEHNKKIKVNKD